MRAAVFLAAIYPDGSRPGTGRLPCPHCGGLHPNPENGSDMWPLSKIRALEATKASLACAECGKSSTVRAE